MSKENLKLGRIGEKEAEHFLVSQGYRIIARNYRTRFGEIDLIASEGRTVCFIEVKTRKNLNYGLPCESISLEKIKKFSKVALIFLQERKFLERNARFDVVSVLVKKGTLDFELIRDAFVFSG